MYNGHSYLLYSNTADSWEDAEIFCKNNGGHLVTINDPDETHSYTAIYLTADKTVHILDWLIENKITHGPGLMALM